MEQLLSSASSVDTVIIVGIEAHVCVVASVVDLIARHFNVHVVADAVSSRTMTDRIFALERMKKIGQYSCSVTRFCEILPFCKILTVHGYFVTVHLVFGKKLPTLANF